MITVNTPTSPAVKRYDLQERTLRFAQNIRSFMKKLPQSVANREDVKQLVRSSGSIAANYIEADEALGQKDFLMRLRISRKEAKESALWLRLIDVGQHAALVRERDILLTETKELLLIISSIIKKCGG